MSSDHDSKITVREGGGLFALAAVATFIPVLVLGLGILGIADRDGASRVAAEPGAAAGAQIYSSRCASCHGPQGEGGVGPAMTGVVSRFPDVADQIAVVTEGRNAMPAFGPVLSAEQIEAVVRYEREVLGG